MRLARDLLGSGPPLVLVHGFGGDRSDWDMLVPALIEQHRVLAVDVRGHGRSPAPSAAAGYDLSEMAADVWETVDAAALDSPVTILGHSMGGGIAQLMALARPDDVAALVLIDSVGEALPAESREYFGRLIDLAVRDGMGALADWLDANTPWPEWISEDERLRDRERLRTTDRTGYVASAKALLAWRGVDPRLAELHVPTLILVGEWDSEYMQRSAALLVDAIPGAELLSIASAGHTPQRENPDVSLRAITTFLGALARDGRSGAP